MQFMEVVWRNEAVVVRVTCCDCRVVLNGSSHVNKDKFRDVTEWVCPFRF